MSSMGSILNPFPTFGSGGGGYQGPPQQPIILTAPPPQQPAFDMGAFEEMFRGLAEAMAGSNEPQGGATDQQAASLVGNTNVSPVLKNDNPLPGGVNPSAGLSVPDVTTPGTPEQEDVKKKGALNKGGMSVGLVT